MFSAQKPNCAFVSLAQATPRCLEHSRVGASSGIKLLPGKMHLADAKMIIP